MLLEPQNWTAADARIASFLESRHKISSSFFYHQHPKLGFVLGSRASDGGELSAFSGSIPIFGLLGSQARFEGRRQNLPSGPMASLNTSNSFSLQKLFKPRGSYNKMTWGFPNANTGIQSGVIFLLPVS